VSGRLVVKRQCANVVSNNDNDDDEEEAAARQSRELRAVRDRTSRAERDSRIIGDADSRSRSTVSVRPAVRHCDRDPAPGGGKRRRVSRVCLHWVCQSARRSVTIRFECRTSGRTLRRAFLRVQGVPRFHDSPSSEKLS